VNRCERPARRGPCQRLVESEGAACRYHAETPAEAVRAPVPVADAAPDFDEGAWLVYRIAMKELRAMEHQSDISAQRFDYFRRAIDSVQKRWEESHVPTDDDPFIKWRAYIDAVS